MNTIEEIKYHINVNKHRMLADTLTPVGVYLQLRDVYPQSILLESSDYHGHQNSMSYICCNPIATIKVVDDGIQTSYPDGVQEIKSMDAKVELTTSLHNFMNAFEIPGDLKGGLFGYMTYDTVQCFETISLDHAPEIPLMSYSLYQFVIEIDHFSDTIEVREYLYDQTTSGLENFIGSLSQATYPSYRFASTEKESSNYGDAEFLEILKKGKDHCLKGDVFQIVLSRQFHQSFKGDEFNVYRALRSVNPSPYLFYFDYGSFKLMGSSPEAQLVVADKKATIHPIAGTFKRTGDDAADLQLAEELAKDKKENSEHVMLVDLARNDLSRVSAKVEVEVFKEVQFYSHVIHLVSKVSGQLAHISEALPMMAKTFPAGTLSGAPKFKAMSLINAYENQSRGFYGGAIGFLGFNGDINLAIMIRSLMSKDNHLYYQAGAGVVAKSIPESELQEVDNKLAALRKAINLANEF
jgi:anthranilate synthase component 1